MARLFQTNRDPHSDCRAKKRGLLCSPRTTCRHRTTSRQERSTPKSLSMFRSVSDRMQSWGRAQSEVLASRPARQGSPRTRGPQHLGRLPRDVPRRRPSPPGRFAPPARCGCRGTRRRRRKLPRIRLPWAVSRRKPSPSGHFAASAGRQCRRPNRGRQILHLGRLPRCPPRHAFHGTLRGRMPAIWAVSPGAFAAPAFSLGAFRGICGTTAAKDRARARISLMRAL